MNATDTILAILRAPGDIGVSLAGAVMRIQPSDELSWAVALIFWAILAGFVLKLR